MSISWTLSSGTNYYKIVYSSDNQTQAALDGYNTIQISVDGGSTWTPSTSLDGDQTRDICMSSDGTTIFYVTTSHISKSTNSGASFTQLSATFDGNYSHNVVCDSSGLYVYVTTNAGLYKCSDSNSIIFSKVVDAYNIGRASCSQDGQYVYTVYDQDVLVSNNYGGIGTFTTVVGAPYQACDRTSCDSTGQYVLITSSYNLYHSIDYGVSFNLLTNTIGTIVDMVCDSTGRKILAEQDNNVLHLSFNRGVTWTIVTPSSYTGNGNDPTHGLSISPDGTKWAASDSNGTFFGIIPITAPYAPILTSVVAATPTAVTFNFISDFNGGSTLTDIQYATDYSGDNFTTWTSITGLSSLDTLTTATITGLAFDPTGVSFQIREVNAIGNSDPSSSVAAQTVPVAPTLSTIDYVSSSSVTLNFTLGGNGGPVLTGVQYATDYSGDNFTTWTTLGLTGTLEGQTTATISLAFDPTGVSFQIREVNAIGNSGPSSSVTAPIAPSAPTLTSVAFVSSSSVSIIFALGSNGGSALTDILYATDYSGNNFTTWTTLHLGSLEGSTTAMITNLVFNPAGVSFKIREVNVVGNSSPSSSVTAPIAPSAPTLTSVAFVSSSSVSIIFALGSNGGSALTDVQYATDYSGDNFATWTTLGLTGTLEGQTTATITGLGFSPVGVNFQLREVNVVDNSSPSSSVMTSSGVPCFLEGSQILCQVDGVETYVSVETLRPGTLVKTARDGYKAVQLIGHRDMTNSGVREKNSLYVCTKAAYPELTADLTLTGCHAILVGEITDAQRTGIISTLERIFITDQKYRLPACIDERAHVVPTVGTFTVWHFALEHTDIKMNYGVYAQGLLVESSPIWHMTYKNYTLI